MFDANQERGDVFEFSRKGKGGSTRAERGNRKPPVPRRAAVRRGAAWQSTALFSLSVLLVIAVGLGFHAHRKTVVLEQQLAETMDAMQVGFQKLGAGVQLDSARRQLLLGVRDEILRVNEGISLGEAYHYAELLVTATDKYPTVDPALLLSIGIVESGFDPGARSHADARGLYQIWPSTGRMLAGMLGWEYEDEILYDAERNTEMAALYLDILMTTYNDVGMVLAEYNGGPINAGYYRAGSHRAAAETRDYVPKVLGEYERLARKLPAAPGLGYDILYRDGSRGGKRLGEVTATTGRAGLRSPEPPLRGATR